MKRVRRYPIVFSLPAHARVGRRRLRLKRACLAMRFAFAAVTIIPGISCRDRPADFEIVATFPHDSTAYTQGLVSSDSVLFESTGQYRRSDVRRVELKTGRVLARTELAPSQFAEGLTLHSGRLFQLTWKEHVAYVYDSASLARVDSFSFAGEGWGLASDGTQLFLSDGSDSIRVVDPASFTTDHVIHVRDGDAPLQQLNELEFFNGKLYANVYQSTWIAIIDPATGLVERMLDFADLYPDRAPYAEVMNGIAVSPDGQQLLLTGKFWPTMFQVRILPPLER